MEIDSSHGSTPHKCGHHAFSSAYVRLKPAFPGPEHMSNAEAFNVNQVLRLKIEEQEFKGLIVTISDDAILVATTSQDDPGLSSGAAVQGELFKPEGLYSFTSRLLGYQRAPVLVFILDRPRAIRRIQRRREPRHPVTMTAQLIFISADRSINTEAEVRNLSFGGLELVIPAAPSPGFHCIVLLRVPGQELSTICQVMHVVPTQPTGYRVGLSFIEMSRRDLDQLHTMVSQLDRDP